MNWNPRFDLWFVAVLGVASFVVATWSVFRSQTLPRRWLRGPVWLLRVAALALLLAILANPVRHDVATARGADSLDVLLVDTSQSMALEKPQPRFERALTWSRAVAEAAPAGRNVRIIGFGEDVDFAGASAASAASTRLARALRRVLESNPGRRLANIVVISDGRIHDRDELPAALALAQQRRVPISTHTIGSDQPPRNVFIRACRVERSAPTGARVPVDVEVGATGLADGTTLELSLKDETGKVLASAPLTLRERSAQKQLTLEAGLRTTACTVSIARLDDELTYADNDFRFTLEIADPKIRVLYFEGSNYVDPEWNDERWNITEHIPRAWKRAGDIECDLFVPPGSGGQYVEGKALAYVRGYDERHAIIFDRSRSLPKTREEWFAYDVIICSDVLRSCFTPEQLDWVVEFVTERGGGYCMIGGNTSFDTGKWDQTVWEKIIPVDMLAFGHGHTWKNMRPVFPESVLTHPILQIDPDPERNRRILAVHPAFEGFHDIRRAKPGATVLGVREDTGAPLIAVQNYGKGRSMAFLSDSAGRWGQEYSNVWGAGLLGDKERRPREGEDGGQERKANQYFSRFWVNTVRWLAENSVRRERRELLGRSEAITYRPGATVKVAATLLSVIDPAELPRQAIGARLALDGQERVALAFDRDRKEFTGKLKLPETLVGTEVAVVFDGTAKGAPISDEIRLRVMQLDRELENPLPDAQLMADIAQASGGAVLAEPADALAFFAKAQREAADELVPYAEPLWSSAWVWAALLALFTIEWTLRRFAAR